MANNYTYYGTAPITTASGFISIFNYRVSYLFVQNTGANPIYITTDGKTAPVITGADGVFVIPSGGSITVANQLPLWYQSASVMPKGSLQGTGPGTGTPYEIGIVNNGSLWGGTADPGTVINTLAATAATTFTITAAG